MGKQRVLPKALDVQGYPAAGLSENYSGLCAFACNYGYCPEGVCSTSPEPLTIPTVSPFLPKACVSGSGNDAFAGLCSFACNFGFCPMHVCTCTGRGALNEPPSANDIILGTFVEGLNDYGICSFSCSRGYCPSGSCVQGMDVRALEDNLETAMKENGYSTSSFANYNLTDLATKLVGWEGCTAERGMPPKDVYSGWVQSWKIMNLMYKEAKSGIDFNSAAAVEYLGPPAQNYPQQSTFNNIFLKLATIQPGYISTPFDWRIHVRCDDPDLECDCGGSIQLTATVAYTRNDAPPDGIARINFCPRYFTRDTLDTVMMNADLEKPLEVWANMYSYYRNQGAVWFHELLHINWVSMSQNYGHNQRITDIRIEFERKLSNGAIVSQWTTAYGPLFTKTLARWSIATGLWTVRNADSFTIFALARYVQSKFDLYPHLPLAPKPPTDVSDSNSGGSDYFDVPGLFNMSSDGTVVMDADTTEYDEWGWDPTAGACALVSDEDGNNNDSQILTLSADFAAESVFPTDYMSSWSSWAGLTTAQPTTTATPTSPPAAPTPTPSYDCEGATLCSTTNVKWCDEAVNNMDRGSKMYTASDTIAVAGNCWANAEGFGCSVSIRGTDGNGKSCQITGDDMWNAYQDIRNVGDCAKCGSKHFGNGCLVSVDYYYGCDNRDSGPNRKTSNTSSSVENSGEEFLQ